MTNPRTSFFYHEEKLSDSGSSKILTHGKEGLDFFAISY